MQTFAEKLNSGELFDKFQAEFTLNCPPLVVFENVKSVLRIENKDELCCAHESHSTQRRRCQLRTDV